MKSQINILFLCCKSLQGTVMCFKNLCCLASTIANLNLSSPLFGFIFVVFFSLYTRIKAHCIFSLEQLKGEVKQQVVNCVRLCNGNKRQGNNIAGAYGNKETPNSVGSLLSQFSTSTNFKYTIPYERLVLIQPFSIGRASY